MQICSDPSNMCLYATCSENTCESVVIKYFNNLHKNQTNIFNLNKDAIVICYLHIHAILSKVYYNIFNYLIRR